MTTAEEPTVGHEPLLPRDAERAAYVRSQVCAFFSVAMGFALYSVFAPETSADAPAAWMRWALGFVAAVAVGWFLDQMKATVERGEVRWSRGWRQIVAALMLLIAFELFTSVANESLARDELARVSAQLLGQQSPPDALEHVEFCTLLRQLKGAEGERSVACTLDAAPAEEHVPETATIAPSDDAERGRLIQIIQRLPIVDRFLLFSESIAAAEEQSALNEYLSLYAEADRTFDLTGYQLNLWKAAYRENAPAYLFRLAQSFHGYLPASCLGSSFDDCRDVVAKRITADLRPLILQHAIGRLLERNDIHAVLLPASVRHNAGIDAEQSLKTPCDALSATSPSEVESDSERFAGNYRILSCVITLPERPNNLIEKSRVFFDVGSLFMVWWVAAASLAHNLTRCVFSAQAPARDWRIVRDSVLSSLQALLSAAVAFGLAVVGCRLLFLLVDLIARPPRSACLSLPFQVNSAGTGFVWLLQQGMNLVPNALFVLTRFSVPSWLSVSLIFGTAAVVAVFALRSRRERPWQVTLILCAPIGICLLAVWPILGSLLFATVLVILAWAVPAVGLGIALPYLRPTGRLPTGLRLFAAGLVTLILVLLTFFRLFFGLEIPGLFIALGAALLLAILFQMGRLDAEQAWILYPPIVAFLTFGFSTLLQPALLQHDSTFLGILGKLHVLTGQNAALSLAEHCGWVPLAKALRLPPADDAHAAANLELALVTAISFWLSFGLIAAWKLRQMTLTADIGAKYDQ